MKKLFLSLSLVAAFMMNAQHTQEKKQEKPKQEQTQKTPAKKSTKKTTAQKSSSDDYLDEYKNLNLTTAQKNKIKALHQRRISKNSKMKNSKNGLTESQYKARVKKILTKQQQQKYEKSQH